MVDYHSPMYLQLRETILEKIKSGVYLPGQAIPSEREMASFYGVNRMTVKHAVSTLVEEGLLYRIHGSGTFVKAVPGKIDVGAGGFGGLSIGIRAAGMIPQSKVLYLHRQPASPEIAALFSCDPQEMFYHLGRVRQADSHPFSVQYAVFPAAYFPGALEIDFSKASLYEFMGQMGRAPVAFKDSVQAVAACPKLAKLLELSPGQIVFQCDYLSYDKDNCLVEQNRSFFRPDKVTFKLHLHIE
ncbi:GntR family transcriptional regulator [Youxingia wuxianensis]|uniref:GntR family transcriptional regulator n=1 Tax=Youxingia wuxianensis TaxID=2763678 RepID=A0A926ES17_9FIRM|nr:GntR family transcriptional regulator [Youxingia wuxianensis]MBC8585294.1 GntR family transcriptional regulator [Youxingia wuxianensis]